MIATCRRVLDLAWRTHTLKEKVMKHFLIPLKMNHLLIWCSGQVKSLVNPPMKENCNTGCVKLGSARALCVLTEMKKERTYLTRSRSATVQIENDGEKSSGNLLLESQVPNQGIC